MKTEIDECSDGYAQIKDVQFDFSKKKLCFNQQINEKTADELKRKSIYALSQSPKRKEIKMSEKQYPGSNYFQSLFKNRTQKDSLLKIILEEPIIEKKFLPNDLQLIIKNQDFNDVINEKMMREYILDRKVPMMEWNKVKKQVLAWIICKLARNKIKYQDILEKYWDKIDQIINFKNDVSSKEQWKQIRQKTLNDSEWDKDDDSLLKNLVQQFGTNQWELIVSNFNKFQNYERSLRECKDRWFDILDPDICLEQFKKEEDLLILQLVQIYGKKWNRIWFEQKQNNKRTKYQIKKRFELLLAMGKNLKKESLNNLNNLETICQENDDSSQSSQNDQLLNWENEIVKRLLEELNQMADEKNDDSFTNNKEQKSQDTSNQRTPQKGLQVCDLYSENNDENQKMIVKLEQMEEEERQNKTPLLMNQLSRSLMQIHLDDDCTQLDKVRQESQQKLNYTIESPDLIKKNEISKLQFCLVNEKTNTIYFPNLAYMQKMIKLLQNQNKLRSFISSQKITSTHLSERNNNNDQRQFCSQQFIKLNHNQYPIQTNYPLQLSSFASFGITCDKK